MILDRNLLLLSKRLEKRGFWTKGEVEAALTEHDAHKNRMRRSTPVIKALDLTDKFEFDGSRHGLA